MNLVMEPQTTLVCDLSVLHLRASQALDHPSKQDMRPPIYDPKEDFQGQ